VQVVGQFYIYTLLHGKMKITNLTIYHSDTRLHFIDFLRTVSRRNKGYDISGHLIMQIWRWNKCHCHYGLQVAMGIVATTFRFKIPSIL